MLNLKVAVRYDVLKWVLDRTKALSFIDLGSIQAKDLCDTELKCITNTLSPNRSSAFFWVMARYVFSLASWGHRFMGWLHGCPCHQTREERETFQERMRKEHKSIVCPMAARMSVPLALGGARRFSQELDQVGLRKSDALVAAEERLSCEYEDGADACRLIFDEFCMAKSQMAFRLQLTFDFWLELPWAIVSLMAPWVSSEVVSVGVSRLHLVLNLYLQLCKLRFHLLCLVFWRCGTQLAPTVRAPPPTSTVMQPYFSLLRAHASNQEIDAARERAKRYLRMYSISTNQDQWGAA